jgi:hypothetical protein
MSYPINIVIPKSIFTKMVQLRESKQVIYNYLFDAFKSYFEKNLNCEESVTSVNQIRFTLVKRKRETSEIQMHFINRENPKHIISDESGMLKKRMENFYKFESDIEFITTILYFFCKHYGLDFNLVSDKIYEKKIRVETSDITKKNSDSEFLKYIYLDLKPVL